MDNNPKGHANLSAGSKDRRFAPTGPAANDNIPPSLGQQSLTPGKLPAHDTAICEGTVRVIVGGEYGDTIFFLNGSPSS